MVESVELEEELYFPLHHQLLAAAEEDIIHLVVEIIFSTCVCFDDDGIDGDDNAVAALVLEVE